MQLKTRVKVNTISNLHDARYCAGMGVEMIGFPISPSHPHFINSKTFQEIRGWLEGIQFVGEITNIENLAIEDYQFDYIQFEDQDLLSDLKKLQIPLIFKLNYADDSEFENLLERMQAHISFFLLESDLTIDAVGVDKLKELAERFPIFLSFGLDVNNIESALEEISPEGIGLAAGKEIKVGVNDLDNLADILELLEID